MSSQGYGTFSFFSHQDELISGMLVRAGLKNNCSRVLLSLHYDTGLTSRDIERITGLRQPEVSVTINHLIGKGWVLAFDKLNDNSVRTIHSYQLAYPIDSILDFLMIENQKVYNVQIAVLEKIRDRTSGKKI